MAYDVYPYSYRNFRLAPVQTEENFELPKEQKRGDLEGYLAAKDFASKTYSACVCSEAQANIRQLNNLRPDMTSREYINVLIKQGQVPEKHFKYQKDDSKEIITELNSNRDVVKQVIFMSDAMSDIPVISRYYNPDSREVFKEVFYHSDGNIETKTFYENFCEEYNDEFTNNDASKIKDGVENPIMATENPFKKLPDFNT